MLEYVIGTKTKAQATDNLLAAIRGLELDEGTFYVGYPVLTTQTDTVTLDALLTSKAHGVIVFDLLTSSSLLDEETWRETEARQESIYLALASKLLLQPALAQRRQLAIP